MSLYPMRFRSPLRFTRTRAALLLALLLLPAARADHRDGFRDPLSDQIEVVVIDREVVAIDAEGGGDRSAELSLRETVGFHAARGIVGVALTSDRVLFFSANRGWLSMRWLPDEQVPERVLLGERVALLATTKRVIGFNAESGIGVDEKLGRGEPVHDLVIGANAGAALTSRRLLGLSLGAGRFIEEKIGVSEPVEALDAGANIITATTPRRLLIFRAAGATWEERPRRLR